MVKQYVLIIDSKRSDANKAAALLQAEGHRTMIVPSGEEAMSEINNNGVDLVIMDHENLPDSGIGLLREISKAEPDLPVIILSRDKSFESAIEALRSKATDYLQKPISDDDLLRVISQALSQRFRKLQKAQYYKQVDYLWTRIKHLDKIDLAEDDKSEVFEARFFAINKSTMIDLEKQAILHDDKTVPLSPADIKLLFVFLNNPREILSFQDIFLKKDNVELPAKEAQSKLRPMIYRLRLRLSEIPGAEEWIESVRGTGYIFNI